MNRFTVLSVATVMTAMLAPAAGAVNRVCANPVTGEMTTRPRCKGSDIALNASNIWDVLKGKNTYLSACRTVEGTAVANPSTAGVSVSCNSGEFMLNYGDFTTPVALNVVRQNEIIYDGNIPSGVLMIAQNDFGVGDYSFTTGWTFHVTATCCPRL